MGGVEQRHGTAHDCVYQLRSSGLFVLVSACVRVYNANDANSCRRPRPTAAGWHSPRSLSSQLAERVGARIVEANTFAT